MRLKPMEPAYSVHNKNLDWKFLSSTELDTKKLILKKPKTS